MDIPPQFDLPLDDFISFFDDYILSKQVVVVSAIGKLNMTENRQYPRIFDKVFRYPDSSAARDRDPNSLCYIEGRYVDGEKVLYLFLRGPWNANHLTSMYTKVTQDMNDMGFLQCWNMYTNICARALLFIFTMSHIVIIHHSSHTPDFCTLQLLKLLSYMRPQYQVLQTNLLTKTKCLKDEWILHGRLCSPRLLFVFACPQSIRDEQSEEEEIRRTKLLERALEDKIYLTLRKSRIVKYVCNRAFYSIAPNDEFVYVENSNKSVDSLERFLRSFKEDVVLHSESDSDDDEMYLHDFSTEKKGHTFYQFLQKHITKAHNDGFSDNMGKYTHVKPFFQRPTLRTWFEAANAILHDPEIGLEHEFFVFPPIDTSSSSETHQSTTSRQSQKATSLATVMMRTTGNTVHNSRDRQGFAMKLTQHGKREDKRKLRIHRRMNKVSPDRNSDL